MQTLRDEQAAQARGAELRAQNLEKMQSALNKDQELVSRMASEHETKLRAHREKSVQKSRQNTAIYIAIVIIIICVLVFVYYKCHLNWALPASLRKKSCKTAAPAAAATAAVAAAGATAAAATASKEGFYGLHHNYYAPIYRGESDCSRYRRGNRNKDYV